jgi:hypothetical protein
MLTSYELCWNPSLGVWLGRIMNAKSRNLKGVEECLAEMTRIRSLRS